MSALRGRIVLVTGASRGLGRATAIAASNLGAHIIATSRTQGALEALDDEIRTNGGNCTLLPLSLLNGDDIDRLGPSIYQRFGRLDAFVHCAGELGPLTPTHQLKPKDLERVLSVHAMAAHRLIVTCDPLLRAAAFSHAIFVDDALTRSPKPYWSAYQAAKAALRAIVDNYRAETRKTEINVILFKPNPMQTVLRRQAFPGEADSANPNPKTEAEKLALILCTGKRGVDVTNSNAAIEELPSAVSSA